MARNETGQSNTSLRRNRSGDLSLQPGDDELIERQLQHLQQQNLLEQQAILTQKLRSTAALAGTKQHVVGGGRPHIRATSTKAIIRGHGSSTKLNRRPSSRPSSRPTSRASSPDRVRAASYTGASSSVVAADDRPTSAHRRSTSDIRAQRNSSSSNLKKNTSNTSLKKNRSHTEIAKKARSDPIIKRTTSSDHGRDSARPGKHQVHFDLGIDEDEAADQDGDEGEWVDASSSASPVLSRQPTASNSRGDSGQPSRTTSPVLQTRELPAPALAADAPPVPAEGRAPADSSGVAGEERRAPPIVGAEAEPQTQEPSERPQQKRTPSNGGGSASETQRDPNMASTVAPAVRESLPQLPRRHADQRQQLSAHDGDRETSSAPGTPPTDRRAPHRLPRSDTGSTIVATTSQDDSQAGGLTSRFIGDTSQPSQDGTSGSFYGQETSGRRRSLLGDASTRPQAADPRLRHLTKATGTAGGPSSAPNVGGVAGGSPGGISSHGGLGGGFGDSRIQLKLNLAREHPEDDENRIVSAARLAPSSAASATGGTATPSVAGAHATPGELPPNSNHMLPPPVVGMGEYYGGRGYPDQQDPSGRRVSRGAGTGGGAAYGRDESRNDMYAGDNYYQPRGITAIIESYKGASPLYGGDGGGLGGLGGIPIGIGVGVPGGAGESGLLLPVGGDGGMGGMHQKHQYGGGLGMHGGPGAHGYHQGGNQFSQGGIGVHSGQQKNKRADAEYAGPALSSTVAMAAANATGSRARGKRDPRITRELESGGREYLVVRRYQNPVARSAARIREARAASGQPIPTGGKAAAAGTAPGSGGGSAGSTTTGRGAAARDTRHAIVTAVAGTGSKGATSPEKYQNVAGGTSRSTITATTSRLPPTGPGRTFEEDADTAPSAGFHHRHHRRKESPVLQMRRGGLSHPELVEDVGGSDDGDEDTTVEGDDEHGTLATLRMMWEKNMDLSTSQD